MKKRIILLLGTMVISSSMCLPIFASDDGMITR